MLHHTIRNTCREGGGIPSFLTKPPPDAQDGSPTRYAGKQ